MEIKYEFLYDQEAKKALGKIFSADLHGDFLSSINKLQRHLEKNFKIMSSRYQSLVHEHAEKTEEGKIKEPHGPGSFKIKDDAMGEWTRAVTELMHETFTIDGFEKIHLGRLLNSGVSLSSVDLQHLEPILSGLDLELDS